MEQTVSSKLRITVKVSDTDPPSHPWPPPRLPTLHDEVDAGGLGVVVRLHRAGVGALIVHVHVLDHDAVLGRRVHQDDHTRVYGPLVIPGVEDGAAVQPGYPGDPVVNRAPGERTRQVSQGTTKKHMPSGSSWQGWDDWSPCSQCTQGHLLFGLARVSASEALQNCSVRTLANSDFQVLRDPVSENP